MVSKLFGIHEAGTEDSVLIFEQEIHHQSCPLEGLILKESVGCFGMRRTEGKQLGGCITNIGEVWRTIRLGRKQ